jgi:hypothetical protein
VAVSNPLDRISADNGITTDAAGNAIVTAEEQVFVVAARTGTFYGQAMTAGHEYMLAGNGQSGLGGLGGIGGPALQATLNNPGGVVTDQHGNVAFTDSSAVLVVAERSGTLYGQAMTAGDIYIVAGGGHAILGDGGPATDAGIGPESVALTPAGALLVADPLNNRVRKVS